MAAEIIDEIYGIQYRINNLPKDIQLFSTPKEVSTNTIDLENLSELNYLVINGQISRITNIPSTVETIDLYVDIVPEGLEDYFVTWNSAGFMKLKKK